MSIMNDFEGVKKILNDRKLTIQDLYELLKRYNNEIGNVELKENGKIIADVDGKYLIEIYIVGEFIKIERVIEKNHNEEKINLGTDLKSIDLSIADRMVEQIYDLIKSIDENGNPVEHITGVKKVLFVKQEEGRLRNHFYFTTQTGEKCYEIKENKILKDFTAMNSISRMQEFTIQYRDMLNGKYIIIKTPYTVIEISKNSDSLKTLFEGVVNTRKIKVEADYSNNHHLIEVDDIVVGAVDSLNSNTKDSYRVEVNDLNYEYLIVALIIIIDLNYDI